MRVLFAFAVFVLASALAEEKRDLFGTCVEECTPFITDDKFLAEMGFTPCPDGQVCMSNGCGHTCQPITSVNTKTAGCGDVFCRMFCANGFQLGPDGCPICQCA